MGQLNCQSLEIYHGNLSTPVESLQDEKSLNQAVKETSFSTKLQSLHGKFLLPLATSIVGETYRKFSRSLENGSVSPEEERTCCFGSRTRHIVLVIGTLCIMMVLSNILILHVTIVYMTSEQSTPLPNDLFENSNSSQPTNQQQLKYTWSPTVIGGFYASMSLGSLVAVPCAVYLIRDYLQRIGARKAFAIAGLLSAISTALNPVAADWGTPYFILTRIGEGIPLGFSLPVIGSMSAGWSTVKRNGLFLSVATSFAQLAPAFTYPISGLVSSSSLGWPASNYIHAAVTFLLFTLWVVFYRDSPHSHACVSAKELEKITARKAPPVPSKLPILSIFTSKAIWAVWITIFAHFVAIQLYVIYMPAYLNNILGLAIEEASLLAPLPPLAQIPAKIIAAVIADRQKCVSQTTLIRIFNTISSLGCGFFLVILALISPSETFWSMVLLIVSSALLGFNIAGVFRSTALVAKQHTYFVTGVIQFIYCFILLSMPYVVDALESTDPEANWSTAFIIIACLLSFSNVVFCVIGKGKAAKWTDVIP